MNTLWGFFICLTLAFTKINCDDELRAWQFRLFEQRAINTNNNTVNEVDEDDRIIGGRDATPGLLPFQAALRIYTQGGRSYQLCGGSLIASNWIVTAAHCIQDSSYVHVRLGSIYRNRGGQEFYTAATVMHPNFNGFRTPNNDIGLIRLPKNVEYNANVLRIDIADAKLVLQSLRTRLRASGWGTIDNGQNSEILKYIDVYAYDTYKCARHFHESLVSANNICTLGPTIESICHGDSGGPLYDLKTRTLVGLASFVSDRGCDLRYPAAFIKVANYRQWIRTVTGLYNL